MFRILIIVPCAFRADPALNAQELGSKVYLPHAFTPQNLVNLAATQRPSSLDRSIRSTDSVGRSTRSVNRSIDQSIDRSTLSVCHSDDPPRPKIHPPRPKIHSPSPKIHSPRAKIHSRSTYYMYYIVLSPKIHPPRPKIHSPSPNTHSPRPKIHPRSTHPAPRSTRPGPRSNRPAP